MTTTEISGSRGLPILLDLHFKDAQAPVVVFCHGYKGYKDWGAWHLVANHFVQAGFNFIKFNFSHNGGTVDQPIDFPDLEAFGNNNYSTELDDLNQVMSWCDVGADGQLAPKTPKFLIGHSRGGAIAVLGASEISAVSGLATWSAVSDFEARFPIGDQLVEWKKSGVYYVENKRTRQQMPHYYQFYRDFQKNQERLDIRRAARNLSCPYLILHGSDDEAVHFTEAMRLKKWAMHAELELFDGVNHTYGSSHPYTAAEMPEWLQEASETTSEFFLNSMS